MLGSQLMREVGVMDVDVVLGDARDLVLSESYAALERSHPVHYEAFGEETTRRCLANLFELVVAGIHDRELASIVRYSEKVATERFEAGFDIGEVQTAYNALEEAMWRHLIQVVPQAELAEAIGLLSTVLGAGKDALARTYVSLASQRHVPSLDLSALFEGTVS